MLLSKSMTSTAIKKKKKDACFAAQRAASLGGEWGGDSEQPL
jgi:hypothetical protein